MKLIFTVMMLLVLSAGTARADLQQPQIPDGAVFSMVKGNNIEFSCGTYTRSDFFDATARVLWIKGFVGENKTPFMLSRLTIGSETHWVDNDRDGIFDEVFTDSDSVYKKYPTPCDAVK